VIVLDILGYFRDSISDDREVGGNILNGKVSEGRICYDVRRSWLINPSDSAEFNGAYLGKDQGHELERVGSSRGQHEKGNVAGR
jgi:hypothetical protein